MREIRSGLTHSWNVACTRLPRRRRRERQRRQRRRRRARCRGRACGRRAEHADGCRGIRDTAVANSTSSIWHRSGLRNTDDSVREKRACRVGGPRRRGRPHAAELDLVERHPSDPGRESICGPTLGAGIRRARCPGWHARRSPADLRAPNPLPRRMNDRKTRQPDSSSPWSAERSSRVVEVAAARARAPPVRRARQPAKRARRPRPKPPACRRVRRCSSSSPPARRRSRPSARTPANVRTRAEKTSRRSGPRQRRGGAAGSRRSLRRGDRSDPAASGIQGQTDRGLQGEEQVSNSASRRQRC